ILELPDEPAAKGADLDHRSAVANKKKVPLLGMHGLFERADEFAGSQQIVDEQRPAQRNTLIFAGSLEKERMTVELQRPPGGPKCLDAMLRQPNGPIRQSGAIVIERK